ncbi:hypothetical protein [Streptomyces rishiriensis]|uniref:hypothetical protein n=1 Tax=Streptomyces rishiriensis TaxID=68264 RepID=UPI00358F7B03
MAGGLSLQDGTRVVAMRSGLWWRLAEQGAMPSVMAPAERGERREARRGRGYRHGSGGYEGRRHAGDEPGHDQHPAVGREAAQHGEDQEIASQVRNIRRLPGILAFGPISTQTQDDRQHAPGEAPAWPSPAPQICLRQHRSRSRIPYEQCGATPQAATGAGSRKRVGALSGPSGVSRHAGEGGRWWNLLCP